MWFYHDFVTENLKNIIFSKHKKRLSLSNNPL